MFAAGETLEENTAEWSRISVAVTPCVVTDAEETPSHPNYLQSSKIRRIEQARAWGFTMKDSTLKLSVRSGGEILMAIERESDSWR
jgi:hypothetical protein